MGLDWSYIVQENRQHHPPVLVLEPQGKQRRGYRDRDRSTEDGLFLGGRKGGRKSEKMERCCQRPMLHLEQ